MQFIAKCGIEYGCQFVTQFFLNLPDSLYTKKSKKSFQSYSNTIVYNNIPWPTPTDDQKAKIEQTAQAILDARALYPDSSLADLYDELTMPVELRKAHQENDRAVMAAYGFPIKTTTESQCVAELFKLYQELTNKDQ